MKLGEIDRKRVGFCIGFDAALKMPGDERNGPGLRDWPPLMEIGNEMKRKVQSDGGSKGLYKAGLAIK